jgi:lysophospholipase L1-like esterase
MSKIRLLHRCVFILFSFSLTFAFAYSTRAQDKTTDAPIKAITPEAQTAKWAVKWWMPRHTQKLADMKKQGRVDLLMIGDSITHGWEGHGKSTWQQYYTHRHAFNIGFSGDRTENVVWRIQNGAVENIAPKLAVIMIGTNNTGHRLDDPKHTAAGITLIVTELKKRLPKTKVLLLAIFPRSKDTKDKMRQINDATNKIVSSFADNKNVFYLDINTTFLDKDGILTREIMPDLLHPRAKGYAMWAKAMEPTIAKLLGDKPVQSTASENAKNWSASVKFPSSEKPIALFNGKDLTGWEGQIEQFWSVKDGAIRGANQGKVLSSTYLFTKKQYRDFRLILEVKQTRRKGFSTMHTAVAALGKKKLDKGDNQFGFTGPLLMLCNDWGIWDAYRRNRVYPAGHRGFYNPKGENKGDWNQIEILVKGNRIRMVANGTLMMDFTDKPEMLQKSPLGLQLHSNNSPQEHHFKGLILAENPTDKLITLAK